MRSADSQMGRWPYDPGTCDDRHLLDLVMAPPGPGRAAYPIFVTELFLDREPYAGKEPTNV